MITIVKYRKIKPNLYEVYLDDQRVLKLYDEVILATNLLVSSQIKESKIKKALELNQFYVAYYQVLKYLKSRMRCESEIRHHFASLYNKSLLDAVISRCQTDGYLNSKHYLEAYVADHFNFKLEGPLKIKRDLLKLGFLEKDIDSQLNQISVGDWESKIKRYITKVIATNQRTSNRVLRSKISQNLLSRGFDSTLIHSILEAYPWLSDQIIGQKEAKRLRQKLTVKYHGPELEMQIKKRLQRQGFTNISEIQGELNER